MDRSSPSFGDAQLRALGSRIRTLREARSWSLKRLAGEAAVSVATLQSIESGASSPGLLTIVAIADALGEPVDRLVADSLAESNSVRQVHGKLARRTRGVHELTGLLTAPRMGAWAIGLDAGATLPDAQRPRALPLFALLLSGRLELAFPDGTVETLAKGDSIHMKQEAPIKWKNPGARPARMLCIADLRTQDKG